ncbi:hypothetical protein B0H17DRAFT_949291, partial [Mycena rosella]
LLAHLLHWGLFGTVLLAADLYYQVFPNDRLSTNFLVYLLHSLKLVETILIMDDSFARFGYGFGDIVALNSVDLDWLSIPVMSGLGKCPPVYRLATSTFW